jgi:DNA-binding CsgD family transcriptional regulator
LHQEARCTFQPAGRFVARHIGQRRAVDDAGHTNHGAIRLAWKTSNAYGVVTLEAKWLVPKGAIPEDIAKDPKSCLISVTIELREHPVAHAARVVRESGATPTQVKVGIQLALGKTKPVIADELGIKLSSVADQAKRLYQTLDVHNSTELSTKIWLGGGPSETRQSRPPGWVIEPNAALRRKQVAYNGMR